MSINKFVAPGFLLSIDLLLVSFVNWIYWLLISKLTTASEVGQATSVYSFAVLTSAIALLGLEYSLVKKSSSERSQILGTTIILESLITAASIPVLLYFLGNLYQGSLVRTQLDSNRDSHFFITEVYSTLCSSWNL